MEATGIAAAVEKTNDGDAQEENETICEEVLEEAAWIVVAIEECSEDEEALEEDKHVGDEIHEEGAETEALGDDAMDDAGSPEGPLRRPLRMRLLMVMTLKPGRFVLELRRPKLLQKMMPKLRTCPGSRRSSVCADGAFMPLMLMPKLGRV